MKYLTRITLLLIAFVPFMSKAGWEITGRFIDREGNTILKRYFIQDNIIKVEKYNLIYVCNLNTKSIIIVDPENLVYTKTNLNAYILKLREIKANKINELMALIPDGQKQEYEKMYRVKTENEIILPILINDSLIIRQLPDSSKLLDYQTSKYSISENGRKKEEFYFTSEVNISADFNLKTFLQYVYLLEPEDHTLKYMATQNYLDIVKNGLVTRRFMFEDGYKTEWQVNKIDQKKIPSYEFGIPELCKEITLDNWFSRKNQNEDKFYDDYE